MTKAELVAKYTKKHKQAESDFNDACHSDSWTGQMAASREMTILNELLNDLQTLSENETSTGRNIDVWSIED